MTSPVITTRSQRIFHFLPFTDKDISSASLITRVEKNCFSAQAFLPFFLAVFPPESVKEKQKNLEQFPK